ncbi:MAG TPA: RIP metalloprotease RseP [Gammaproteobacteria bacterium]|nr:RIP metalloprotease RseP [Gammaproteobacteria bacterium]
MDLLNNTLFFLIAVAVLVSFHEFGHFIVARWLGVRVLKFSIGFGKTVWRWRKTPTATEYAIGMIPLGGYVRMLDEREGEVDSGERDKAFNRKPLSTRSLIVMAGPAANLLLAVLIYWCIGLIGTEDLKPVVGSVTSGSSADQAGFQPGDLILSIDGRPVKGWSEHRLYLLDQIGTEKQMPFLVSRNTDTQALIVDLATLKDEPFNPAVLSGVIGIAPEVPRPDPIVSGLVPEGPSEQAGIMIGDRIVAIDGQPVEYWVDLVEKIATGTATQVVLKIDRNGTGLEIPVETEFQAVNGRQTRRIGIYGPTNLDFSEYVVRVRYDPVKGALNAIETTWRMSALTVRLFGKMVTGDASREHLSGPISIARFAGRSASLGLIQFLAFLAVLSISLGIINLLPIPVLDGGHLVYFAAEGLLGRPLPERVFQWGQQFGIVFIVLLMGLAFYNDLLSLLQ